MLILLHGDDTVSSRKALEEIKLAHKESEISTLDAKKTNLSDLKQALESSSIWAPSRLVVLENFFSSRPSKEELSYLSSGNFASDLVLWEGKQTSPGLIKKFGPRIQIKLFKPPAIVFQFLDNFSPKSEKGNLLNLKKTLSSSPQSLVFYILVKRIRDLLLVKDQKKPSGIQVWQLRKLQNQAKQFSFDSLQKIYQQLLLIDIAQKTGEKRFDLAGELEMLILDLN